LNPRTFEYHAPRTIEEAVALAGRYGGESKFLAGGQSLIPLMKLRIAAPSHLIDLNRITGLEYIRKEGSRVILGPLTRMAEIERSDVLLKSCGILCECASQVADPLVRNMGTIGGNISHADPTNDVPAVMVATRAEFTLASPRGERTVPARDFFLDSFTTALAEGEILLQIRITLSRYTEGCYVKLERQPGDFAIVGAAASVQLGTDGRCRELGIGLTAVGPTVVVASGAEEALVGTKVDNASIERAAKLAAEESHPTGDIRGSADYKRAMVEVVVRRALTTAHKRARARLG
jgi:carbon-monoxide dehydrogenase medium subunit